MIFLSFDFVPFEEITCVTPLEWFFSVILVTPLLGKIRLIWWVRRPGPLGGVTPEASVALGLAGAAVAGGALRAFARLTTPSVKPPGKDKFKANSSKLERKTPPCSSE